MDPETIRQIMMTQWDPAGVRDDPAAQDQYDDYAQTAHRMLTKRGADAVQLYAFLQWVESEELELAPSSEAVNKRWQAVDSLMALGRTVH